MTFQQIYRNVTESTPMLPFANPLQTELPFAAPKLAVVIPCYRVTHHIVDVVARIGPEVSMIFAVDDKCPDGSGQFIEANISDPRLKLVYNAENKGVGGAVMAGYRAALAAGADVTTGVVSRSWPSFWGPDF